MLYDILYCVKQWGEREKSVVSKSSERYLYWRGLKIHQFSCVSRNQYACINKQFMKV